MSDSSKTVDEIMALVDGALTAQRRATLRTALTSAVIDPAAVREAIAREVAANWKTLTATPCDRIADVIAALATGATTKESEQ